jgi:hypothetical protein
MELLQGSPARRVAVSATDRVSADRHRTSAPWRTSCDLTVNRSVTAGRPASIGKQERWLANRSSFRGEAGSAVAPPALWRATSACDHERRLVAQILPRWNRLQHWFELIEAFRIGIVSLLNHYVVMNWPSP